MKYYVKAAVEIAILMILGGAATAGVVFAVHYFQPSVDTVIGLILGAMGLYLVHEIGRAHV